VAENVADFFGAIVPVENTRLCKRSPPITFPRCRTRRTAVPPV
jgi:hypothetical protein